MKSQSDSIDTVGNVPVWIIALYAVILFIVLYLTFSSNFACLFESGDGAGWFIEFKTQAARQPFSQLGVDPLQGNFDAYYPVFREYFLPEALSLLFRGTDAGKVAVYFVYSIMMLFTTYTLARAVGFSRTVAYLGGALFAVIAFPTNRSSISWIFPIYNLNPHIVQDCCIATLIIACFWSVDLKRPIGTLALALVAIAMTLLSIVSDVTLTVLMFPVIAVYGGSSIFASSGRAEALTRIAVAVACVAIPIALGMVQYLIAIAGYTAYHYFDQEFMQARASLGFASIIYQSLYGDYLAKILMAFSLLGAFFAIFSGQKRLKLLGLTYILATAVFQATAALIVIFAPGYKGPSPIYFEFMVWPIIFLFNAFAASVIWNRGGDLLQTLFSRISGATRLAFRHGLLVAVPLFLASWNVDALATGNFNNCAAGGFFPDKPDAITEYLKAAIATDVGVPFRGLVATFNGVKGHASFDRLSQVRADSALYFKIGNDLRETGLWWYGIPTLMQYSPMITPSYYLLLTDFLSRPEDKQIRNSVVLTRPNESVLKLWGVRFIITDSYPDIGQTKIKLPVTGQDEVRLAEFDGANLGDYSPTEVRLIGNFHDGLALMHEAGFDGKQTLVTDQVLEGPFVPATAVKLVYQRFGFSVRASSSGRSILVLPIQYSRCWRFSGESNPVLFRADLMQLGISFTGKIDGNLIFRFGPMYASQCRMDDIKDMERLRIRDARAN